jgi:peptidoglycan/xylan/chitin deacetylase (PgdA/CDA1 family)
VLEIWQAEFDWMHDREGGGVLTICMHPQVIGRGSRIAMLEQFVGHCRDRGATFSQLVDVASSLPA